MTIPADDAAVVVDTGGSRFVLGEGGGEAELIYVVDGDPLLLVHTEVPCHGADAASGAGWSAPPWRWPRPTT